MPEEIEDSPPGSGHILHREKSALNSLYQLISIIWMLYLARIPSPAQT